MCVRERVRERERKREEVALSAKGIAASTFHCRALLLLAIPYGLSTQNGFFLAKPICAIHLHQLRSLSPPLSPWCAECGCQPQYQQPHWVKLPDKDCCCSGLFASEHYQGGQGRSSQVGQPSRNSEKGMSVARVFGLDAHSALPLRFLAALSLDRNKSTHISYDRRHDKTTAAFPFL